MLQSFMSALRSMPLPTGSQLFETIRSIYSASRLLFIADYADSMHRGAAPNSTFLRMAQMDHMALVGSSIAKILHALKYYRASWLITPFMFIVPILINSWPREHRKNSMFDQFKSGFRDAAYDMSADNRLLVRLGGKAFYGLYWLLNHIPTIENPKIIRLLDFCDFYLLELGFVLLIGSYAGLYLLGNTLFPVVASLTLGLAFLDQQGWVPRSIRETLRDWLSPAILISGLFLGGTYDMVISACVLPLYYGQHLHLKPLLANVLKRFDITKEYAHNLEEQMKPTPTFDFRCHTSQFLHAIQDMATNRRHRVNRAYVLDSAATLPPKINHVEYKTLIQLFNKINWNKHNIDLIQRLRHRDWRLKRDQDSGLIDDSTLSATDLHKSHIAYLHQNLISFVHRMEKKSLRGFDSTGIDLLERYTQGSIVLLQKLADSLKDTTIPKAERNKRLAILTEKLIILGFETGDYCPTGLLGVTEETYRTLSQENTPLTLKQRVRYIEQGHREFFFQEHYMRKMLYGLDDPEDRHAYSRAVWMYAPRLGLPSEFVKHDMVTPNTLPFLLEMISAGSAIEHEFWTGEAGSEATMIQNIRRSVNMPMLPIQSIMEWYDAFIDNHTFGTEEEKEALKDLTNANYPIKTNTVDGLTFYQVPNYLIQLMLLDFGNIVLAATANQGENYYRPKNLIPEPEAVAIDENQLHDNLCDLFASITMAPWTTLTYFRSLPSRMMTGFRNTDQENRSSLSTSNNSSSFKRV